MKAVYLKPRSTFRTELRADTLWGLILVAIYYLYSEEELKNIIKQCLEGNPPFILSSAMPFVEIKFPEKEQKKNEIIEFFYRPILPFYFSNNDSPNETQIKNAKKTKKIKFITKENFEKVINGEINEHSLIELLSNYLIKTEIKNDSNLKNTIDRLTGTTLQINDSGQLFYSKEKYVEIKLGNENKKENPYKKCDLSGGLYFLIKGDITKVEPALRFLSHYGFGGDNSNGKGHFDVEIKDFNLKLPENPNSIVNLGLYLPTTDEVKKIKEKKELLWYELVIRRGRVSSHFKEKEFMKPAITCLGEGSIFSIFKKEYYGKIQPILNLSDKTIYQYGYAFPIPALIKI